MAELAEEEAGAARAAAAAATTGAAAAADAAATAFALTEAVEEGFFPVADIEKNALAIRM
jgi:hypothetical protein